MIKRPCRKTGCRNLVQGKGHNGYCDKHKDEAGFYKYAKTHGNRHQRGYGSTWVNIIRPRILERDNHLCVSCLAEGKAIAAYAVDHIIPKAHGGTDDDCNLQSLCEACHDRKTALENKR